VWSIRNLSSFNFHFWKNFFKSNLASHQHFVKKEEKRGAAFSEKRGILPEKEEKKRKTVLPRRKLKPTDIIILQILQNSHVINID